MIENLVEFWRHCRLNSPPFFHPVDEQALRQRGQWPRDGEPIDHDTYVNSSRFEDSNDTRFHLSLIPIPYVGNPLTAEIVVLLLNPGFKHSEYWAETQVPGFRDRLKRNLYGELEGSEVPFFCLDPRFCWYSGFQWWEKKLRSVLQSIALQRFSGNYLRALHDLSFRLACVELVPYHSASFGDPKLIDLPSAKKAREFVRDSVVPATKRKERMLIVTRQAAGWDIQRTSTSGHLILYEGGHTRGASLSENSEGGKAILRCYGIVHPTSKRVTSMQSVFGG